MKIICVAKGNDPRCLGGIEIFERNLYKIFKEDIKFLVWNSGKDKIFECQNIENIQDPKEIVDKIKLKIFGKTRCTVSKIKEENPDVVIINKPKDIRMIKGLKCKKILVQHGSLEAYNKSVFKNKKIVDLIKKYIDYYVCLSDKSSEVFSEGLRMPKEKIITIRHSCEVPLLKEKKEKNRKLIIIARLENNQKRIDLAIKAMKRLQNYTLEIYGDGPHEDMLKKLTEEEKVQDRVFFRGRTTQIKEKLDEAGIFIMTSDSEGYPLTIIEAMMRGLPVVLRNTFEAAEDIVQENGVLLPKEWHENEFVKAVENVYENYEKFSKKSLELAKRHSFDIIEEKWKKLLYNIKI